METPDMLLLLLLLLIIIIIIVYFDQKMTVKLETTLLHLHSVCNQNQEEKTLRHWLKTTEASCFFFFSMSEHVYGKHAVKFWSSGKPQKFPEGKHTLRFLSFTWKPASCSCWLTSCSHVLVRHFFGNRYFIMFVLKIILFVSLDNRALSSSCWYSGSRSNAISCCSHLTKK